MPKGIHVANVPIDAAVGWTREDGSRAHQLAGTTVDELLTNSDAAMYLAKAAGKGRVAVYEPTMRIGSAERERDGVPEGLMRRARRGA